MTPTLTRFVQLARHRIYGTVLSEQELAEVQREEELDRFKRYLAQRVRIEVRLELFWDRSWDRNAEGCSLQFIIDEQVFVLQQTGSACKLIHRVREEDVPLTLLANDGNFEDHLLVAVDDALRPAAFPKISADK